MIKERLYNYFDNIRIEKENKEVDLNKKINMGPSYVTSCKRQIYYKKTNTPASNPNDSHSYIKFALGDATHEKIVELLKNMGIHKSSEDWEFMNFDGVDFIYRIDNIVEVDGKEYIIEVKSTYMAGWNAVEKQAKE
jgi:hypothetical protein